MTKTRNFNIRTICLWLLPWYPILQMYYVGSLSLGFLIFTPMLMVMFTEKRRLKKDKSLMTFFFTLVGIEFIQLVLPYTSAITISHNLVMQTISLLSIICFANYIKYDEFLRPYIFACIIMIAGMFYQVYQLFVLHSFLNGPIVLFPSLIAENNVYTGDTIMRPMSFFQEPQAFCSYIIVFVIFMLQERKYLLAGIATLAILLSTSTEGLVLSGLVWILFVMFSNSSVWMKGLVAALFFGLASLYTSLELFSVGFDKATNTDYGENVRLVTGFRVLGDMDGLGWLFGMGTTPNSFYQLMSSKYGDGDVNTVLYFSSATGAFINYGIFVGIAYWIFLIKKMVYKYKMVFILGVCLCVMPFAQTCFWSSTFVYLFSMYYMCLNHCEEQGLQTISTKRLQVSKH